MIPRYEVPEIADVWSDHTRMANWLEIELLAVEAWSELGVIPEADARACRERASFTVEAVNERERVTRHDVAAFVDVVATSIGEPGRWIHFGMTSSDVTDTGLALQLRSASDVAARRPGTALGGDETPRPRASGHDLHRSHARRARGADLVRAQARRLRVPARSGPRAAPARARGRLGRRDQRRGGLVCEHRPPGGGTGLRAAGVAARRGVDPGDPAGPPRRVRRSSRRVRVHAGGDRDRDPASRSDRGPRGSGAVRGGPEGLLRDAAQAEPRRLRARQRPGPRGPRPRRDRARGCRALARARHLSFLRGATDLAGRDRAARVHAPRPDLGRRRAGGVPRPDARTGGLARWDRLQPDRPARAGGRGAVARRGLPDRATSGSGRVGP